MNLDTLIDQFIGEDTKGRFDMNAIREAEERGYNYAKAEIKSRKQELIEGIAKSYEEAFKKAEKQYRLGSSDMNNRLVANASEFWNFIKSLTGK